MTDTNKPHRPGCDALGGYGHGVGQCDCGAAPPTQEAPADDLTVRAALQALLDHCADRGWWLERHAVKVMDGARAALATPPAAPEREAAERLRPPGGEQYDDERYTHHGLTADHVCRMWARYVDQTHPPPAHIARLIQGVTSDVLKAATPPVEREALAALTDDDIREVFLANGFTIKDGHTDLKPYVYAAARSLLVLAAAAPDAPKQQPDGHLTDLRGSAVRRPADEGSGGSSEMGEG